ncbi:MAG: MBL fold metallo-hydrolase [Akkermansiaceae bacterium]|nr:MBL fold metallo-hydrolase [Akkermansiaceae bacterium]
MSRYGNPWAHDNHGFLDILRWKLKWGPQEVSVSPDAPDEPAGWRAVRRDEIAIIPEVGWRVTWLGHASFLLQGGGVSLLIDPIYSDHCAPVPIPSLRRMVAPPCSIEDLPQIHAVLLTHGHYDHLDLPTLRRLGMETRIVVAEGHAAWLRGKGFKQATELAWHECDEISPGIGLTSTPAQHFTARSPFDRNRGHWCGWFIEGAGCKLWHAGDSGYCPAFREIGERHGPADLAMIPIGAYQPRAIMRPMHLNPEEAVQAFLDAGCRSAVAMHWGTFRLTDEPMGEPPILLERALGERSLPSEVFQVLQVGDQRHVMPFVEMF